MTWTVDLAKKQVTNSNCEGNCGNTKTPTLTTNKDGSITLKGTGSFDGEGFAAFSITITNNIKRDGTLNVKSAIVTDNKSPFEVIMNGTENGKKGDGLLLNTVSQTLAPMPMRGLRNAPKTAEDKTNMDVQVWNSKNPDDANLGFVKNAEDKEFINPVGSDSKKASKPLITNP